MTTVRDVFFHEEIMRLILEEDLSLADVARKFLISRQRVHQIVSQYYGESARSLGILKRRSDRAKKLRQARLRTAEQKKREAELLRIAFQRQVSELRKFGFTQEDIARRTGRSQSWVSVTLLRLERLARTR